MFSRFKKFFFLLLLILVHFFRKKTQLNQSDCECHGYTKILNISFTIRNLFFSLLMIAIGFWLLATTKKVETLFQEQL